MHQDRDIIFLKIVILVLLKKIKNLRNFVSQIIGQDYIIFKKSIIRSTPERELPMWLKELLMLEDQI